MRKQSLFRDSGVHLAAVFPVRLRTVEADPQSAGKLRLYVNSWGKEKPIERKKQVVKNETERSEVEFSLPAFARWVIEICTEYENGSV